MTIKITYAALHSVYNGEYNWYATRIARRFGGDGFELNEATIQFFIEDEYCVGGGALALFGVLAGDKRDAEDPNDPYMVWLHDQKPHRGQFETNRELYYARWKHLFAALERYASSKQIGEGMTAAAAVTNAPKRPRVITIDDLARIGACSSAISQFRHIFGESAEVTEENARKAVDDGLPVSWLGRHALVSPERRVEYNELSREAQRSCPANEPNGTCQCNILCAPIFVRLYNEDAPAPAQEAAAV